MPLLNISLVIIIIIIVVVVTNDLANSYTWLPEAREAAQDRVYWRMFTKHSATHL